MKSKKPINFGAIGIAMIFLFNPNVNIIDVLPDFIGYILLCVAITSLADINDTVAEALEAFKRLIFIDAAKILAVLWVFGISVTSERNSSLMLWSFAFGVLEIAFAVPAFIKLFAGISSLGYLHDNSAVFGTGRFSKKTNTDKTRNLTVIFVTLKALMSFLPELSDLTSTEYYENAGLTNLYQYIGIMRLLAFVPVLLVGVVWIIKALIYFRRIDKDVNFVEALEGVYKERVVNKKGIFVKRNLSVSFWILLVAVIFSFDFRMENVNMLPDFVCGALFIAFFICIAKKINIGKALPILLSSVYVLVSLSAYIFEFFFFKEFYYGAIDRSMEARNAYVGMATVSCAATVVFAIVFSLVLGAVKKVINEHTGVIAISEMQNPTQSKMTEAIKKELNKYVMICYAMLAVYCITDICYILLSKDFTFMFLINALGAVAFICSVFKLYFEVSEAVNSRYILE